MAVTKKKTKPKATPKKRPRRGIGGGGAKTVRK